jgi:Sulfotransferase family
LDNVSNSALTWGAMAGPIHIDDLARPVFTDAVEEIRQAMAPMARSCELDSGALHAQATAETGMADFGPRDYEARLEVLLAAMRDVPDLTPLGVFGLYSQLLQLLKNRLLLIDLLGRHPEIHDIELRPPVIIAGLPRTGTTHLHNLLAAGPAFRSLPYWESVEPIAPPGETGMAARRERTELALWFMNQAMPLFPLMHEMTTDHVHEEIALLAIDFSTVFFETIADVPAWRRYYQGQDQTPHYQFLRTALQALQHERGGQRWLLKSPQHLEQLPVLATVFPDATVIVTHRDPVSVTVSMATMIAYTARMYTDSVDTAVLGRAWADRIDTMLSACVRDRDTLPPSRSMDLRFEDFMRDDLAVARQIYELAREPLTEECDSAMTAYLASHLRGRLGEIDYRAQDVGLDEAELAQRFSTYAQRFL